MELYIFLWILYIGRYIVKQWHQAWSFWVNEYMIAIKRVVELSMFERATRFVQRSRNSKMMYPWLYLYLSTLYPGKCLLKPYLETIEAFSWRSSISGSFFRISTFGEVKLKAFFTDSRTLWPVVCVWSTIVVLL